jgi:hypothetical protein
MSDYWWRAYQSALHHPKLLMLPDRLFRAWFNLMCVASKNAGVLPAVDVLALELRINKHKAAEYITQLVVAGLFDKTETDTFVPHNWGSRQFQSDVSTDRVKRFRKRKRNVSVTPPDTEADTDTEAEKKEKRAQSALSAGWPRDFREQFWAKYPNKVGKPKALDKARKRHEKRG